MPLRERFQIEWIVLLLAAEHDSAGQDSQQLIGFRFL